MLHNPALRGSVDLPGVETKLVGHFPEARLMPSVFQCCGQSGEKGLILSCLSMGWFLFIGCSEWVGEERQIKIKYTACFTFSITRRFKALNSSELVQKVVVKLSASHFIL